MTLETFKLKLGRWMIASATGRWNPFYDVEAYKHGHFSFSQCGEDLTCANLLQSLEHKGNVSYIDIGCFHPIKFSNTYYFYCRGGSGLVVDFNKSYQEDYQRIRPLDKFICAVVSNGESPVHVREHSRPNDRILEDTTQDSTRVVNTRTLENIISENWPAGKEIGFLDIDCEGHDLSVLASNNWEKYRPWVVCVEDFGASLTGKTPIYDFMTANGYLQVSNVRMASFYVDRLHVKSDRLSDAVNKFTA